MPPRCQLLSGSLPRPTRLLRAAAPAPILRTFTTTSPLYKRRKGGDLGSHLPENVIPRDANIPEYPYGPATLYRQSNKGLYGGLRIRFGNNVSKRTETKTRRHFKPNILTKSLYSLVLKRKIKLRVAAKVLKIMDREGGLDEYLLKESQTRIKELGPLGWKLRWTLMQRPEVIQRLRSEAAALGLTQEVIDQQWPKRPAARDQIKETKKSNAAKEAAKEKEQSEWRDFIAEKKLSNFQREVIIQRWAKKFKKDHVAPDMNFARVMAKEEMAKKAREIKWAGSEKAWRAWQKAKARGLVEKAGGDEAWFAQQMANKLMKQQEMRAKAQKLAREAQELQLAQPKDQWEAVIDAKKGVSQPTA